MQNFKQKVKQRSNGERKTHLRGGPVTTTSWSASTDCGEVGRVGDGEDWEAPTEGAMDGEEWEAVAEGTGDGEDRGPRGG